MSRTWRLAPICVVSTLLLSVVSCADDPPVNAGNTELDSGNGERDTDTPDAGLDTGSDDTGDTACPSNLAAVYDTAVSMGPGESAELTVFFGDCDESPFSGESISFTVVGEAGGSQLSARSAITDANGEATVTLAAGDTDTTFDVEAATTSGQTVTFGITVTIGNNGAISATMTYGGRLVFDRFEPLLFEGESCADIGVFNPPTAFLSIADGTRITQALVFSPVPVGTDYAVTIAAYRGEAALAFGCTEGVSVAAGQTEDIVVDLADIPVFFDGVYELDNEFDLSTVLPPSIETTLNILAEMTDDDAIDGDAGTDQWGVDPAAFLLDFVYRQFCCWEAVGTDPDWDSCNAQDETHNFGDLELLYREDFRSWDGAQPRTTGLCGAIDDSFGANQIAQNFIQGLITDFVPDIVLRLLDITGDLARAFTDMRITSILTVSELFTDKTGGNLTHELITMHVELHDLDGTLNTYEVNLAAAGLRNLRFSDEATVTTDDVLEIPRHSFRLDMGRLFSYVYRQVLLRSLDCDPNHTGSSRPCNDTGELFQTWIDCGPVGTWMEENVGLLSATTYEGFCESGLDLAGTFIEDQITSAVDIETVIVLQGSVRVGEINELRQPATLVDGEWDGTLREAGGDIGDFEGVFDGVRTGDP